MGRISRRLFQFNRLQTGGYDSEGNNVGTTGDPFASFLLGQVHNGTFHIAAEPTFYERYAAPWVNVDSKVTNNLTLTFGLRFDYQTARIETNDQYSSFDINTPNPGAGGRLGAQLFAGTGLGRTGSRKFQKPPKNAWGPRFGFAYRHDDKTVVRGGYGVYYSGISNSQFTGLPILGFENFPAANNTNGGLSATYFFDDGIPRDLIIRPPFVDPTVSLNQSSIAVAEDDLTLPRFQNWSVTIQRQLSDNMVLDVFLHREPRNTADQPPLVDGTAQQHERSLCSRPGRGRVELRHQLSGRTGCRYWSPIRGLLRQRSPGLAAVPASPKHPLEERAHGEQHLPLAADQARQALR